VASNTNRSVALLSVHPVYADAILRGEKTVEFRRRPFGRPVERVLVYATAPVQQLVGAFDVASIDVDTPASLWDRYGASGCIGREAYDSYYAGAQFGAAIRIKTAHPAVEGLPLYALGDVRPPQSYQYVDDQTLARLPSHWLEAPQAQDTPTARPVATALAACVMGVFGRPLRVLQRGYPARSTADKAP
jgi:predicted transcriptional regulator